MFPRVCVNENTGIKNGDGLPYLNATIVCIIRAIVQKSWCEKNPKKWRARSGILFPPVHLIPIRSRILWPVTGKTSLFAIETKVIGFNKKLLISGRSKGYVNGSGSTRPLDVWKYLAKYITFRVLFRGTGGKGWVPVSCHFRYWCTACGWFSHLFPS